jgi:hypothetical protein
MADLLVQLQNIRKAAVGENIDFEGVLCNPTGDLTFKDPNANGGSPVTLSQLIAGIIPASPTFISLPDTPVNYASAALKFLRVNAAGDEVEFVTTVPGSSWLSLGDTPLAFTIDRIPFVRPDNLALEFADEVRGDQVKTAEPATSGILGQGDGLLEAVDATDLTVDGGSVKLIKQVSRLHTREHLATWTTQNITVPGAVLSDVGGVVVLEDVGFTGTATPVVVSFATATPSFMQTRARLGYTVHNIDDDLVAVLQAPRVYKTHGQGVEEIWRTIGTNKLAGTGIHQEIAATLTSSVTASVFTGENINFRNDPTNAHEFTFAAEALMTFEENANDGTIFAAASTSFPASFNASGVKTALTGQKAVVHQVYHLPGFGDFCQLGTTDYQNFDTAAQSLIAERINNPLTQTALIFGIRHSYVIIRAGITQWADGDAKILPIIGGGSDGGVSPPTGSAEVSIPSLSFMASVSVSLTATPKIPNWDIVNHDTVDATYFSYPIAGAIGTNEIRIEKKGLYKYYFTSTDLLDSGTFANPGMGLYVNGVERNGTLAAHAITSDVTITDKSNGGTCLLDVNDLVTPGFYRFSGGCSIFGGRIAFGIEFIKAVA